MNNIQSLILTKLVFFIVKGIFFIILIVVLGLCFNDTIKSIEKNTKAIESINSKLDSFSEALKKEIKEIVLKKGEKDGKCKC